MKSSRGGAAWRADAGVEGLRGRSKRGFRGSGTG
jgi:hypothetical protein